MARGAWTGFRLIGVVGAARPCPASESGIGRGPAGDAGAAGRGWGVENFAGPARPVPDAARRGRIGGAGVGAVAGLSSSAAMSAAIGSGFGRADDVRLASGTTWIGVCGVRVVGDDSWARTAARAAQAGAAERSRNRCLRVRRRPAGACPCRECGRRERPDASRRGGRVTAGDARRHVGTRECGSVGAERRSAGLAAWRGRRLGLGVGRHQLCEFGDQVVGIIRLAGHLLRFRCPMDGAPILLKL